MKPYYQDEKLDINIYQGDCRELSPQVIPDGSVDLIFTDPPYPKEYHYCYEFLAQEAARVLKPNGFLIAYAGPYWKQKVMETLGAQLDYFYDFVLMHNGNTSILWPRRIISGYKSLLCYTKKGETPLPVTNVLGKFEGTGSDKRYHMWGQDMNSARYYIDVFSRPGDLVVDYFLGAGTFGEVSKALGRRFVGFELDGEYMAISQARLEGGLGPLVKAIQPEMAL